MNRLLRDLRNWPHLLSRVEILFGHSLLNQQSIKNKKTEMRGLTSIDRVLLEAGLGGLEAPARQNETTYSIVNVGGMAVAVSHKTAARKNSDCKADLHFSS